MIILKKKIIIFNIYYILKIYKDIFIDFFFLFNNIFFYFYHKMYLYIFIILRILIKKFKNSMI